MKRKAAALLLTLLVLIPLIPASVSADETIYFTAVNETVLELSDATMNEEQKEESVRLPGEVVEYYEQPETREIVEIYVQDRLLPGRRSAASVRKKKKHRLGLWIFLICLAIAVGLAALVYFWPEKEVAPPAGSQETYSDDLTAPVKIPVFKPEKGVRMALADGHDQVLTAQKIYSKVNPAVVTVIVQLKSSVSIGTGVLFTSNGYLMTNYHGKGD